MGGGGSFSTICCGTMGSRSACGPMRYKTWDRVGWVEPVLLLFQLRSQQTIPHSDSGRLGCNVH